mmetsp:Transcript_15079/g.10956  ORF Transcript_15079/g.10956 Transcript_15079/m.10956 type:complete len:83 (+) Transcript_15079:701-949(+)
MENAARFLRLKLLIVAKICFIRFVYQDLVRIRIIAKKRQLCCRVDTVIVLNVQFLNYSFFKISKPLYLFQLLWCLLALSLLL